jgi:hypothetical protein
MRLLAAALLLSLALAALAIPGAAACACTCSADVGGPAEGVVHVESDAPCNVTVTVASGVPCPNGQTETTTQEGHYTVVVYTCDA